MQETQILSMGQEDPLEKEMATHSSILVGNPTDRGAWRSQRVGHDLVTKPNNNKNNVSFCLKK